MDTAPARTTFRRKLPSFLNLRWRGSIIVAIPTACWLASVLAIAGLRSQTIAARAQERQSREILLETNRLVMAIQQAETGVRGYGLTREPEFIQRYQQARDLLPRWRSRLQTLAADATDQQRQQIEQIQALAARQLTLLEETVTLINGANLSNTPSSQLTAQLLRNEAEMQMLSEAITQFSDEQQQLQRQYENQVLEWRQLTTRVQWLTLSIGVLATGLAAYLFSRLERDLSRGTARLNESNLHLKAIFDHVVDGLLILDSEGKITAGNAAAAKIFGYDDSETLKGMFFGQLVADQSWENGQPSMWQYLLGKEQDQLGRFQEIRGQRQQGETFAMEIAISQMRWQDQPMYIAIARDITERKQSQLTLRKQAKLLETANDAIIVRDLEDRITYWNRAAERLYGWSAQEAIGQSAGELLKTQYPAAYADIVAEFLEKGEWRGELIQTNKNDCQLAVATTWSLQRDAQGQPLAKLEINKDITASKLVEETLRSHAEELAQKTAVLAQTTASLEKRNQELDQFAYIVSHDLKAPLRAIANLSSWIEEDLEGQLDEETQYQMDLLRKRVHRMEALINGLLQYSRVGRVRGKQETVNVEQLVAEVIDLLDPPPEFTIRVQSPMPTLTTERLPLQQVFTNLISNAIKHHNRRDGTVTIAAQEHPEAWEFAIADDGPGIEPKYHEKIFVMFQTLQPRDKVENTGVGLAIIKKILEDQGGSINLKSQPGQGTTFYFTWRK